MALIKTDFQAHGVSLVGLTWEEFYAVWGANMALYMPFALPEGMPYYRLTALTLDTSGQMAQHLYTHTDEGAPDPSRAVVQYWQDGDVLAAGQLPYFGLPPGEGLVPKGQPAVTDGKGIAEWIWGGGEGFDPITGRGPHHYWVCQAQGVTVASDVVLGFGWRLGTNHWKLSPTFTRVTGGTPPPPPEGDVAAAILELAGAVDRLTAQIARSVHVDLVVWPSSAGAAVGKQALAKHE